MSERIFTERLLVRAILEHPFEREWTFQGLGMLRTYLSEELRLHVWDARFRPDPEPSLMHTHPWHFHSTVIAGRVSNRRFVEGGPLDWDIEANRQLIRCGTGGGLCGVPDLVRLKSMPLESYSAGASYTQAADEIHVSSPDDGTVTLCEREFLDDEEHAYVYWPRGEEWVTAEPRPAETVEIASIVSNALVRWDLPSTR